MLKRKFELNKPYRVVLYLRMSDPRQNPRSPDQQDAVIRETIARMHLPWIIAKVYRDDGISGRLLRKRVAYQQMMREIKTGIVTADLVAVDTLERFGRIEELSDIRKKLWDHDGVLLVTADSHFADPTTPQGKAFSSFEAMRATEDGRIKAHQVVRGKRDLARLGYWPGGPRPFGLMLVREINRTDGLVLGSKLVPHPDEDWIMNLTFVTAHDTGWGETRLTKFLNARADIPDKFKPFHKATVGRWLQNTIYFGQLTWDSHSTDIIGDARVIERNADEEILRVPDFCEPLVTREIWDAVNQLRLTRGEAIRLARAARLERDGKLLVAPAPGMVLKYLLTGLVRCGLCGRSMDPSSSTYTNTNGVSKKYVSYVCPGYIGGICLNSKRVPEEWLRETVVARLRDRLFPVTTEAGLLLGSS